MRNHRITIGVVCVVLAMLACGCQKKPLPNQGQEQQEKPEAPFFRLTGNNDISEAVFNLDSQGRKIYVETNIAEWTAESNADWCKVEKEDNCFWIKPDRYEVKNEEGNKQYPGPRVCNVTVKAGTVFNRTIKVAQQSWTFFSFPESEKNLYVLNLPADGGTYDVQISTNVYYWEASTEADWLTLKRIDNGTLRVTSKARAESVTEPRSARVVLTTPHDQVEVNDFMVQDADPILTGSDYGYEDDTAWDE